MVDTMAVHTHNTARQHPLNPPHPPPTAQPGTQQPLLHTTRPKVGVDTTVRHLSVDSKDSTNKSAQDNTNGAGNASSGAGH